MRTRPYRLGLTLVCVALSMIQRPATAHARGGEPISAGALIDALPEDAELVLVADELGKTLASPAGEALKRTLDESGFFRPSVRRWGEFASLLSLEPEEAIDDLLGRRVVLVARDASLSALGAPGRQGAWGVMTWIPPEIERRVRKGIRLTPRQKVDDQPVLAAEQGEFSIIMLDARSAPGQRQTVLLLCPSSDDSLVKPMIAALRRASEPRAQPLIPGRDRALGQDEDATLRLRLRTDGGGALELSARPTGLGWRAELLLRGPGKMRDKIGQRHVSERTFRSLAPRSMVLLSESAPDRAGERADAGLVLSSMFTEVPERFRRILGGRTLLMVERRDEARPGLRLVLASESSDVGDPVAEGDRAIGALLSPGAGSAPPEGAIEGQYPRAVRTDTLATSSSVIAPTLSAAWAYSPERRAGRRWWALSLSERACDTAEFRAFVDALASEDRPPERGGAIALGLLRPRELVENLSHTPWAGLAPIRAATNVERVSWSLSLLEPPDPATTLVAGWLEIEMRTADDAATNREP